MVSEERLKLIEDVSSDICDNYCKYPYEHYEFDEMLETICVNCPLLKLSVLAEVKE